LPWRKQTVEFSPETWNAFLNEDGMTCITDGVNIIAVTWDTEDDDNPNQVDRYNAEYILNCMRHHQILLDGVREILKEASQHYPAEGTSYEAKLMSLGIITGMCSRLLGIIEGGEHVWRQG
jgi:hypothetical protein